MSIQHTPPGLDDNLEHYTSGGETGDWLPLCPIKYFTCAYILQDDKVNPKAVSIFHLMTFTTGTPWV